MPPFGPIKRSDLIKYLRKHGVSFDEASAVFYDENALQFFDPDHSESEDRFIPCCNILRRFLSLPSRQPSAIFPPRSSLESREYASRLRNEL